MSGLWHAPSFEVQVLPGDAVLTVRICGELDLNRRAEVKAAVAGVRGPVLFDLSACDFLDSSGLGVILACRRRGLVAVVCRPIGAAARTLQITMGDTLPCFATVPEAVDALTDSSGIAAD